MPISLDLLKAGGSCFTIEERDGSLFLTIANDDRVNFTLIVRRLLNEVSPDYTVLATPDGRGGYESAQVIPHNLFDAPGSGI